MLLAVVDDVAPLAPSREVGRVRVRRIVIDVSRREAHERPAQPVGFGRTVDLGTVSVPPRPALPVEPPSIAGMEHLATVGTTAPLAAPGCTVKPD